VRPVFRFPSLALLLFIADFAIVFEGGNAMSDSDGGGSSRRKNKTTKLTVSVFHS
jgi:hypothetical protein